MPETLCFDTAPEETLAAFNRIRANLHRPLTGTMKFPLSKRAGSKIQRLGHHLSFETIKTITPAAALVLASEFERRLKLQRWQPYIANGDAWSREVFTTLQEVGFFQIVGFGDDESRPTPGGERFVLRMKSGETTDTEAITSLIENLKQLYPSIDDTSEASLIHLYGAMVEAVGNVVSHAYPGDGVFQYPHIGRWWLTGAVDRVAGSTTAVVFDQGVTIPVSLPSWHRYAGVKRKVLTALGHFLDDVVGSRFGIAQPSDPVADAYAIKAAVEESVTSTQEAYRGHGLAQMRDFVDKCREGSLRIMSRNGAVVYRPGRPPETRTFGVSVGGTLIEWRLVI